jgi:hypothetical protein
MRRRKTANPRASRHFCEWAILDSNQGPLPYQRSGWVRRLRCVVAIRAVGQIAGSAQAASESVPPARVPLVCLCLGAPCSPTGGRSPLDQTISGAARWPSRSSPSGPGEARREAIVLTAAGRGATSLAAPQNALGSAARDDYAQLVAYAFDPSQPGARRLLELARQLKRLDRPTPVEILAPLLVAAEGRPLHRGDQVVLPAGLARRLIETA